MISLIDLLTSAHFIGRTPTGNSWFTFMVDGHWLMLVEIKGHIHCSVPGNQEDWCYNHQALASDSQHEAEELYLKNKNDALEYRIYHIFINIEDC